MIKKITLAVAVVLFAFVANAQIKINAGAGLVLPMGTFGDAYKMGFGGYVGGKYMLNDNMAVGATIGFASLKPTSDYETLFGDDIKYTLIPVAANFTYYFGTEGFKPYAGVDLGYYVMKAKIMGISVSTNEIGFAPTLGFEYSFSDKLGLDVNAKYHYIMTEGDASTAVGVNVGIVYNL